VTTTGTAEPTFSGTHSVVGDVWIWLMDGAVKLSQTLVGQVPDVGYQIVKGK
jgi:hypothetical protein